MQKDQWVGAGLVLTLVVLVGVGLVFSKASGRRDGGRVTVVHEYQQVMGTTCSLAAVVPDDQRAGADAALRQAETTLRAVEALMSTWLADSEISRLAAAPADRPVPLSPQTLRVLRAAREAYARTGGAFDVTCRPLVELWRRAGEQGTLPNESELADARDASKWELIDLTDTGAVKQSATARVDLGGIAKGYAIDRAAQVLRAAGLDGGLVDIGGDLVCFGRPPAGETWTVEVKNPCGGESLAKLRLRSGAVCTSGSYARFTEIAGKRYSHIIDPRTGHPADAALSVTVVAPDAVTADIWATALSVLGPNGLELLPDGVEAMLMTGTAEDHQLVCTAGFHRLLEEPLAKR